MALEVVSNAAICSRCGTAFSNKKNKFHQNYGEIYKGSGYMNICKTCLKELYDNYLAQCNNQELAVRQVCRKLDLFWDKDALNQILPRLGQNHVMEQYVIKLKSNKYLGKCYDDSLKNDGTLWNFNNVTQVAEPEVVETDEVVEEDVDEFPEVTDEVMKYWGRGRSYNDYSILEDKLKYWKAAAKTSHPNIPNIEEDFSLMGIIKQICLVELDLERDRSIGDKTDKNMSAFSNLLGIAGLKPKQNKQEDLDEELGNTPLGVWLYRYENKRPLPEIDETLKDVNGIKKYVFTWMGHLCKMLGIKNTYSDLYQAEIEKYKVEKPEYDGDDDETIMMNEVFYDRGSDEEDEYATE